MLIGYSRISTSDQSLDMQNDALKKNGCEMIFSDVASGVKAERAGLKQALSHLRSGDTLVVWRLDRLGRSLLHLIQTVKDLSEKGISFKSVQEAIDTTTSGGQLFFHIFGALAQFERELTKERIGSGLKAARARGKFGGRPRCMTDHEIKKLNEHYSNKNIAVKDLCKLYNITKPTLYRYVKQEN